MDLKDLTHEHFTGLLNAKFRIQGGAPDVELELIEAMNLGTGRRSRRDPFSLIFRGPGKVVFPQRIYRLHGDSLGTLEIFLVPIGPDGDGAGMLYEAIFA